MDIRRSRAKRRPVERWVNKTTVMSKILVMKTTVPVTQVRVDPRII